LWGETLFISFSTAKYEPEKMLYTREHLALPPGPQQRHTGVRVLHTLHTRNYRHLAAPRGWVKRNVTVERGTPSPGGAKPSACWRHLAAAGRLRVGSVRHVGYLWLGRWYWRAGLGLAAEFAFRKTSKLLKRVSTVLPGRSCADFDFSLFTSPKVR